MSTSNRTSERDQHAHRDVIVKKAFLLNVKTVTAYPNFNYPRRVFGLIKVLKHFLWLGTYCYSPK